ncbi:MAG: DNA-binding response OmpR family regulator/anti-sigma regulatory factor (Ser/Thr protein kinase) [Paraglaciecola sp.]
MLFPFVRRIVSSFESHAQKEEINFLLNYHAEQDLQLELDKDKLETILNNVLSNAMKFTPKGGKIIFNVEDRQHEIAIKVKDTGRGIHPDDIDNVFNRFYQSNKKNAQTEGGTGIGLALSKEFIKLMNGKIWVESEWTVGSTFFITLPRKEVFGMVEMETVEETVQTLQVQTLHGNVCTMNTPKILIVEDNYSLRDYLETILTPHYQIETAKNGQVALDILENNKTSKTPQPDLILSDIMMPVMDGYELLTILKSKADYRNIPVIMLTARADIQDKLKALRIGVDDYLLKPFDEEELLTRIKNLLVNYEERQALAKTENIEETTTEVDADVAAQIDAEWLEKMEEIVIAKMQDSQFSTEYLAELMFVNRKTLYLKIKILTGLTPNKYIRSIRLQKAKILLEEGKSVKETAYQVGFQKVQYFSKLFKSEYGKSPSNYLE